MEFLSKRDAHDWMQREAENSSGKLSLRLGEVRVNFAAGITFTLPPSIAHRVLLAKAISELCVSQQVILLYDDWGVWPSTEHMPMFYKFRSAYGQNELLMQFPGQVFTMSNERD